MSVETSLIMEKWQPILGAESAPAFKDDHRKAVTAVVLENTEKALAAERAQGASGFGTLSEAAPTNATGANIDNWDPILISLVRRATPNLVAFDIAGVQPMSGPTGLIFAMKSHYGDQGSEALFGEADSGFSGVDAEGTSAHGGSSDSLGSAGIDTTPADGIEDSFGVGHGMTTAAAEALGGTGSTFNEMSFSIDKTSVTAKSRALKAEYTTELAQDLKAVHGLDAEGELSKILSNEIIAEINRETLRTVNSKAILGCTQADVTADGVFDLDLDADGRWSVEKYKGLILQIKREANAIATLTRRGAGNFIIVSSDVAAVLSASGMLDNTPALAGNATIGSDPTGTTQVGTLTGGIKVFLDPYATVNYVTVGYKGTSAFDAGMFYCPYVPLQMVRAVGENTFQPKIGFKTRYGMVSNPFVTGHANDSGLGDSRANQYYRIFEVRNILGTAV